MQTATTRDILRVFWQHVRRHAVAFWVINIAIFLAEIVKVVTPLYYREFFNLLGASSPAAGLYESLIYTVFINSINASGITTPI